MSIYQPSPVEETAEVTISTASITLDLENNTLYYFDNAAITEINLDAATGLKYCGFDFATGSTDPLFTYPDNGQTAWIFTGADCSDGIFVPVADVMYRVAIEKGFGTFIGTVQKVDPLAS